MGRLECSWLPSWRHSAYPASLELDVLRKWLQDIRFIRHDAIDRRRMRRTSGIMSSMYFLEGMTIVGSHILVKYPTRAVSMQLRLCTLTSKSHRSWQIARIHISFRTHSDPSLAELLNHLYKSTPRTCHMSGYKVYHTGNVHCRKLYSPMPPFFIVSIYCNTTLPP